MLKRIIDLPENVLGIEASGEVTAEDYLTVLAPELEAIRRRTNKYCMLYVLGDTFDGYTGADGLQDAKVGLTNFTRSDRIAVVTDTGWIRNSVMIFGFAMMGQVHLFTLDELQQAKEWVMEPTPNGNLGFEFLREQGVLILQPDGDLEASDFQRISSEIDPYIEQIGDLKGVVIEAEHLPSWEGLSALVAHIRFVEKHRKNVNRLAVVSDDYVMSALPFLATHFLVQFSRHFAMAEREAALVWVSQA